MTLEQKLKHNRACRECARSIAEINADCNDCRNFVRGKMIAAPGLKSFEGHCARFDKPTKAFPNCYTGHECFEHRRAETEHTCVALTDSEFDASLLGVQASLAGTLIRYTHRMETFMVKEALEAII